MFNGGCSVCGDRCDGVDPARAQEDSPASSPDCLQTDIRRIPRTARANPGRPVSPDGSAQRCFRIHKSVQAALNGACPYRCALLDPVYSLDGVKTCVVYNTHII